MKRYRIRPKPHPNNPGSTMPPRTKPMNRESKKHRQEREATCPLRRAYVEGANLVSGCQACCGRVATDCHEIPAGAHRQRAVRLPNTWLALCRECHEWLQGIGAEEQAAIKFAAVRRDLNYCFGREAV